MVEGCLARNDHSSMVLNERRKRLDRFGIASLAHQEYVSVHRIISFSGIHYISESIQSVNTEVLQQASVTHLTMLCSQNQTPTASQPCGTEHV